MSPDGGLTLFAVEGTREYGARVAQHLDLVMAEHEERSFEDGEQKIRPLVEVRRQDVFVIHSLYGDAKQTPNDKLIRLLFFIGALKDAGAERVTAVVPYLCYARKDRRTQARDPITTKYVAGLFEACGADAIMTFDVHNLAAFENAFRRPATNLEAIPLFVAHFARLLRQEQIAVVSPTSAAPSAPSSSEGHSPQNCPTSRQRPLWKSGAAAGLSAVSCWSEKCAIVRSSFSMI